MNALASTVLTDQRRKKLRNRPYFFRLKVFRLRILLWQTKAERKLSQLSHKLNTVCLSLVTLDSEHEEESTGGEVTALVDSG